MLQCGRTAYDKYSLRAHLLFHSVVQALLTCTMSDGHPPEPASYFFQCSGRVYNLLQLPDPDKRTQVTT